MSILPIIVSLIALGVSSLALWVTRENTLITRKPFFIIRSIWESEGKYRMSLENIGLDSLALDIKVSKASKIKPDISYKRGFPHGDTRWIEVEPTDYDNLSFELILRSQSCLGVTTQTITKKHRQSIRISKPTGL
jgi:hypothetical protein